MRGVEVQCSEGELGRALLSLPACHSTTQSVQLGFCSLKHSHLALLQPATGLTQTEWALGRAPGPGRATHGVCCVFGSTSQQLPLGYHCISICHISSNN